MSTKSKYCPNEKKKKLRAHSFKTILAILRMELAECTENQFPEQCNSAYSKYPNKPNTFPKEHNSAILKKPFLSIPFTLLSGALSKLRLIFHSFRKLRLDFHHSLKSFLCFSLGKGVGGGGDRAHFSNRGW